MVVIKTLEELQSVTHAFDEFSTIENCDIPDYYKEIFPKKCRCGAEMIMTRSARTQLQCCSNVCWVKMAHRLNYFISYHGFKDFGEQACLSVFERCHKSLPYNSFLSAFQLSDSELLGAVGDYRLSVFRDIQYSMKTETFMFSDAIASLGIPNVGSRSTLFDVVKDPVTFLDYMVKNRSDILCDYAGIQALSTRYHLSCFVIDTYLLMSEIMPHIVATPKGEMFVAITGKVSVGGKYYTRAEFIRLCEDIVGEDGTQLYKLVETKAQDKLQYVIADEPSNSDKYKIGQRLNKLITAEDFYNVLLAEAKPAEEKSQAGGNM